jgi:DNA-binding NtrC family response regulator
MNKALILVVEDDPLQRRLVKQNLESDGFTVFEAATGKEALEVVRAYPIDLAVVDYRLDKETGADVIQQILRENPLLTAVVVTAFANIETAVEAMRKGAYDYIIKPIDFEAFRLAVARALERQSLRREVSTLRSTLEEKFSPKNLILASPRMEEVVRLIVKAAKSDATVLISGETGTGKELVARSIHHASRRKDGPFLALNIPSLPETLIESELFGAEKGSYTGAHERKIGKFEAASGGTCSLMNRRPAAPSPGQAPARPSGRRILPAWLVKAPEGGRAGDGRHEQGPRKTPPRGEVPARPLLSLERHLGHRSAAPPKNGRHPAFG